MQQLLKPPPAATASNQPRSLTNRLQPTSLKASTSARKLLFGHYNKVRFGLAAANRACRPLGTHSPSLLPLPITPTRNQHTQPTHPTNTPNQHTQPTHPTNTPNQHTHQTVLRHAPIQRRRRHQGPPRHRGWGRRRRVWRWRRRLRGGARGQHCGGRRRRRRSRRRRRLWWREHRGEVKFFQSWGCVASCL